MRVQPKSKSAGNTDQVVLLEANIDDQTGQGLGFALDRLMAAGALDASFIPLYMKKNRPAVMLSVMAPVKAKAKFQKLIFKYTSTKGIRTQVVDRAIMTRHFCQVVYQGHPIKVKIAEYEGVTRATPEYEDCKKAALALDVSLEKVMSAAENLVKREDNG